MSRPDADELLLDAEADVRPSPQGAAARRASLAHPVLLLVGIVLASLNMRAALASVSPLVGEISAAFGLSSTATSLVTSVPVLFLGVGALVAPGLARRLGTERVLLGALLLLAAGILARVLPSVYALYGGGVLVGTAIALLNVLMPGLIKRDFPDRAASMTSVYTGAMIAGATVVAAASVPLERAFGGSWAASLAFWSLLAAVAAVVWLPQVLIARGRTGHELRTAAGRGAGRGVWRSALAWQVTLFMGLQSLWSYVLIAWMPTIFTDQGMSRSTAGVVFAFNNLIQVAGAFLVPLLAGRMRGQRPLVVLVTSLVATGYAGLMVAPVAGAWLWAAVLGVGQGGAVGLALTLIVLRSGDAVTASRLSGMAQTVGYLLAAAGPLAAGAVHEATGTWTVPIALVLGVCGAALAVGLMAARDRKI
ncbi:MFS transporter [Streptomyces sp. WAC05374]|uniref:CynX/NimT family MFS transporter n=1 Tax=Streptomyces sp. WAC05374 TaxID=2487420 RepID=UPI000F873E15|nr:MFS transporter [Streptomyces sp. WAC05374]RST17854.1 MFS transporter [Streptomyces sp. WAC05374]TDF38744.1 MFS transporter [Streptomyces sp. WAC05374]TDF56574.1 MFS transporter [Streptomyces sp. WAC05374]TDF60050.1 MFS transporter [Streptomyces sp. WAC05374]